MATQIRPRTDKSWQKLLQPAKLNPRRRADCVVREAKCGAKPGAIRTALEQAVAIEIDRMRALHESEESVRAFKAATEVHIALCGPDAGEAESTAITHGPNDRRDRVAKRALALYERSAKGRGPERDRARGTADSDASGTSFERA